MPSYLKYGARFTVFLLLTSSSALYYPHAMMESLCFILVHKKALHAHWKRCQHRLRFVPLHSHRQLHALPYSLEPTDWSACYCLWQIECVRAGKAIYQIELGSAHGNSRAHPDSCGWLSSNSRYQRLYSSRLTLFYLPNVFHYCRPGQLGLSGTLPIFARVKEPMEIENSTALVYKQQRPSRKHSDRSLFASRTRTLHMDSLSWCWIAYNKCQPKSLCQ